tara:strand:+ start:283 stop:570 length:288 start_codon:yes stop_codon:yes gene_type:complete
MTRTPAYYATVKMVNGKVAPEDQATVDGIKTVVQLSNSIGDARPQRVKLQGRLGENNPNAWKYRVGSYKKGGYGNCQSVRLIDSAYADVYVYDRT